MAINITDKNFSNIIFHSEKPVLVTFYGSDDETAQKQDFYLNLFSCQRPDVVIGKIDAKKEPALAAMYGIQTVPSVKIFKKGKCTATAAGVQDQFHLCRLIAK